MVLAITISMALLPYMAANLKVYPFRRKIFLGDAGSMFIGFSVVWLLVNGVQEQNMAFRPVTALWLCAVPLMDMVAIMLRRARKGQSVMMPDRDHLHHIFLRAGFTDRQALSLITLFAICLAGIGFAGEMYRVPEVIMFSLFLGVFLAYNWSMSHIWRLLVLFRRIGSKIERN
jgi:UDP-GlcNAc:undecaprenyl-phosphate GlcNAc-1-phosphate transferase